MKESVSLKKMLGQFDVNITQAPEYPAKIPSSFIAEAPFVMPACIQGI